MRCDTFSDVLGYIQGLISRVRAVAITSFLLLYPFPSRILSSQII